MKSKFVHLHVHTEYSLLDGLSKIKNLLNYVKEQGMDACAITDHGAMYGVIDFYKRSIQMGIKPIIGMEAYLTHDDLKVKEKKRSKNYHLLLLAKNIKGYQNLMKLTSIAHLDGYYYRPRFTRLILEKYSKGIICTSSCPQGELPQALAEDDIKSARQTAQWYLDVFGEDYYLEIQRHYWSEVAKKQKNHDIKNELLQMSVTEKKINQGIVKLSRNMGIPIVATNDAHYIEKRDARAQDALVCLATGKTVADLHRLRFIDNPSFYIKSPEEMTKSFNDLPETVKNTLKIAEKCDDLKINLGKWYFPKFPLPKDKTADQYLKELVKKRSKVKLVKITSEIKKRLEYELDIIINKGYAPYFLIVMDMVNWAHSQGIITNTRGSAAGSLVSFVLGITTINPLEYYLPFERFLNPYRPSPPDIDFDVSDNRRDEVIKYISDKYGHEKVAQICTFGRMLSRASIRDVSRVLGYTYAIGDRIANLIPLPRQGFPVTIPKAMEEIEELAQIYQSEKDAKKILDLAMQIEGSARHISVHAAGLVVSPAELIDFTPIQKEPSGDRVITQYEMHACEDVGLIKFDILGVRNLSILGNSIEMVKNYQNRKIDINDIPLDDKKTFEMLGRGETMGIFQLNSTGMTKYLKDLKPTRVEDLMAMVALYRPGPIAVIPEYIKRKKNPKLVKYLDKRMKKFLDASYGLLVYQDDLLFCALELAGYSWEEADKFRKAVGKKIPEEMAAQKEKFIEGIIANGQTSKFAEELWDLFEPFQAYGFNKAHAASYGMVAYQTAYMKANYPVEYMTALLTAESSDKEKVSLAVNECRRMKIAILPPDINESGKDFRVVKHADSLNGRAIRFGLSAVKNVGQASIKAILKEQKRGEFLDLTDFMKRVDLQKVNKKVLESLIKVGAFSRFGNRAAILKSVEIIKDKIARIKKDKAQQGLFSPQEIRGESSLDTYLSDESVNEFDDKEIQTLEKELLGLSLSAKPVGDIIAPFQGLATHNILELLDEVVQIEATVVGVIRDVKVIVTKKSGKEMAFVRLEDQSGLIDLICFPNLYSDVSSMLKDNQVIIVKGKLNRRDTEVSLIANEIEKAAEGKKEVFINIPPKTKAETLNNLKALLLSHPGNIKPTLVFEGTKNTLILNLKIRWDGALARKIADILKS